MIMKKSSVRKNLFYLLSGIIIACLITTIVKTSPLCFEIKGGEIVYVKNCYCPCLKLDEYMYCEECGHYHDIKVPQYETETKKETKK